MIKLKYPAHNISPVEYSRLHWFKENYYPNLELRRSQRGTIYRNILKYFMKHGQLKPSHLKSLMTFEQRLKYNQSRLLKK